MKKNHNSKGMVMIHTIILGSVMMILTFSLINSIVLSLKEQKRLSSKIEYSSNLSLALEILSRKEGCDCQLKNKTFNLSNDASEVITADVEIDKIKTSCEAGAETLIKSADTKDAALFEVEKIKLINIKKGTNPNEFVGDISIMQSEKSRKYGSFRSSSLKSVRFYGVSDNSNKFTILGCGQAPLSSPENFQVVAGPGTGECSFTWTASSTGDRPITYSVVGGALGPGNAYLGDKLCLGSDDKLRCSISGLNVGTTYRFSLQASNLTQKPTAHSSEQVCIPKESVGVPVLQISGVTEASCSILWTGVTGSTPIKYSVYKAQGQPVSWLSEKVCKDTTNLLCSISGLTSGETYKFAVAAKNELGESLLSNTVSCTPPPSCEIRSSSSEYPSCSSGYTSQLQGNGCSSPAKAFMYKANDFKLEQKSYAITKYWSLKNITSGSVAVNGSYSSSQCSVVSSNYKWRVCCK